MIIYRGDMLSLIFRLKDEQGTDIYNVDDYSITVELLMNGSAVKTFSLENRKPPYFNEIQIVIDADDVNTMDIGDYDIRLTVDNSEGILRKAITIEDEESL
jgi:hypothetical protein